MRRYFALTVGGYLEGAVYRWHFIFTFLTNLVFIVVVHFLWRSIYTDVTTLGNMSFNQVFAYMVLAGSTFILYKNYVDWELSYVIRQGIITNYLVKPLDVQLYMLFRSAGGVVFNLLLVTLPSVLVLLFVFNAKLAGGWALLFGPISMVMAYLLTFIIDYTVGLTGFYTESIWGIATVKEMVVLVFSGALIPLNFFPEGMREVLYYLPFQAIYNVPLTIMTDGTLQLKELFSMLGIQVFWVAVLVVVSRLFYSQAVKVLTINGG